MILLLTFGTIAVLLYAVWSVIELVRTISARVKAKREERAEQKRQQRPPASRFKPLHGQRRISYQSDKNKRF